MNARVAQFSGKAATLLGCGLVAFAVVLTLLSLVLDVPWGQMTGQALLEQSITIVFLLLAGLFGGVPFLILGQIILVLVRQRDTLERIAQTLEARELTLRKEEDHSR